MAAARRYNAIDAQLYGSFCRRTAVMVTMATMATAATATATTTTDASQPLWDIERAAVPLPALLDECETQRFEGQDHVRAKRRRVRVDAAARARRPRVPRRQLRDAAQAWVTCDSDGMATPRTLALYARNKSQVKRPKDRGGRAARRGDDAAEGEMKAPGRR